MRHLTAAIALTCGLLAAVLLAAQNDPSRNTVLLRLFIPYGNVNGPHYFGEVTILNGGAVAVSNHCGAGERPDFLQVTFRLIPPAAFSQLQQALTDNRVGRQSGVCGTSPRGGPQRYNLTWYGRNGRTSSFSLGAFPGDCPAEQQAIVSAVLAALNAQDAVPVTGFGDLLSDCP